MWPQIDKLVVEMETLSPLRQKCLAYLVCEVSLRVAEKTKDQGVVNKLKLQFAHMLKDFLFEKVSWNLCFFFQLSASSLQEETTTWRKWRGQVVRVKSRASLHVGG